MTRGASAGRAAASRAAVACTLLSMAGCPRSTGVPQPDATSERDAQAGTTDAPSADDGAAHGDAIEPHTVDATDGDNVPSEPDGAIGVGARFALLRAKIERTALASTPSGSCGGGQ